MGRLRQRIEPDRVDYSNLPLPNPDEFTPEEFSNLEQEILREQEKYRQQQEMQQQYQQMNEPRYPPSSNVQYEQSQYEQPPQYQMPQQMSVPFPPKPVLQLESDDDKGPLSILDKIKQKPTPKGIFKIDIGGRPVDLHVLEDYVIKTSPFTLRTILRYHNAKTIEEMKGYSRGRPMKMNMTTIVLIMAAVGMGILGLIVFFFMPDIMNMFQGGFGVTP